MFIDRAENNNILLIKELYLIQTNRPSVDFRLKAFKECTAVSNYTRIVKIKINDILIFPL